MQSRINFPTNKPQSQIDRNTGRCRPRQGNILVRLYEREQLKHVLVQMFHEMYCNLVALMLFEIVKNCVFVFLETAGFYILSFHQLSLIKQTFKSYKSKLELTSSFRYLALNLDHLDN